METAATIMTRPADFAMPPIAQVIFTYGNAVPMLVIGALALRYARRHGTIIPLAFLGGGLVTVLIEPIVDILGLCVFPQHGAWIAFRAFGVAIPAYMLPVYCWFVGGQAFLVWTILAKGLDSGGLIRLWLALVLMNGLLETPGLLLGLYRYYGDQPFSVFGFPWWWALCNATTPIAAAVLVHCLSPWLIGWRAAMVVPLVPMADGMTNGAIGWPVWLALNSGFGLTATRIAVMASLGLAGVALYCLHLAAAHARRTIPLLAEIG